MSKDSLPLPRELGPYEIESVLGEGGFSVVYRARHKHLDRTVALKVTTGEALADPDRRERIKRECAILCRFEHPNVVPLLDAGSVPGAFYLAMPLVEGATLRSLLKGSGRLPVPVALKLAVTMTDTLARLHAEGILHRDIKPSNILVGRDGGLFLTDFGVAQDMERTRITQVGSFLGTVLYAAPETIVELVTDASVDQYQLGCTLYEALTGRHPYGRDLVKEWVFKSQSPDQAPAPAPYSPPEIGEDPELTVIGAGLSRCFIRACGTIPGERYPDMAAFRDAVSRVAPGLDASTVIHSGAGEIVTWSITSVESGRPAGRPAPTVALPVPPEAGSSDLEGGAAPRSPAWSQAEPGSTGPSAPWPDRTRTLRLPPGTPPPAPASPRSRAERPLMALLMIGCFLLPIAVLERLHGVSFHGPVPILAPTRDAGLPGSRAGAPDPAPESPSWRSIRDRVGSIRRAADTFVSTVRYDSGAANSLSIRELRTIANEPVVRPVLIGGLMDLRAALREGADDRVTGDVWLDLELHGIRLLDCARSAHAFERADSLRSLIDAVEVELTLPGDEFRETARTSILAYLRASRTGGPVGSLERARALEQSLGELTRLHELWGRTPRGVYHRVRLLESCVFQFSSSVLSRPSVDTLVKSPDVVRCRLALLEAALLAPEAINSPELSAAEAGDAFLKCFINALALIQTPGVDEVAHRKALSTLDRLRSRAAAWSPDTHTARYVLRGIHAAVARGKALSVETRELSSLAGRFEHLAASEKGVVDWITKLKSPRARPP